MPNYLTLIALTGLLAGPAVAQEPDPNDPRAVIRFGFGEVTAWVIRAADLVPADQYGYRPAPTVRTFGQLIAHLAVANDYYCGRAAGRPVEWSDAIEQRVTDKEALARELRRSIDACAAVYAGTGQAGPLLANLVHTNLHYGNIVTYLRMMGLVPPSS